MNDLFCQALNTAIDARVRSMSQRPLSPADPGSLTTAEENGIQAVLEQRASDECDECAERFRDYINSAPGRRARCDYRDWRVANATDDERRSILESL